MTTRSFEFDENTNPDQLRFFESRTPICGFTGGYGNGKTAALGLIAITIAANYRDARVLVGRATRPKLEDSTKPELMKWVPPDWIERKPTDRHNNLLLKHSNSTIEFRHIRQEGKGKGEEQSNLLSATYDAILVDQLDDPEFSYKDLADLIGRLRGTAPYIGDDPTMPPVGPQWFRFGANPTRNWLFREVVSPYFTYKRTGLVTRKLMIDEDTKTPIIEVFNAPSSANTKHTGKQYVSRMRAVYRGSMAKRFIDADWSAYEGLVYPDYDETVHMVEHEEMLEYFNNAIASDEIGIVEGYDYGQVSPSCYIFGFYNEVGDVFLLEGFYEPLMTVQAQARKIKEIRNELQVVPTEHIFADPDLFKGRNASATRVGDSIASLFRDQGIDMQRGANAIDSGLDKVSSYLAIDDMHMHPIKRQYGAPRLFVSAKLDFWHNEIADYYFNKNVAGDNVDKPRDTNDHAMDVTKYMFTRRGKVVGGLRKRSIQLDSRVRMWTEREDRTPSILPRHM
jgi:hypothetical protein